MSYLDVISLAQAKLYLGVDDTYRDAEITLLIQSSLAFIEKQTSYIVVEQDRTYPFDDGYARVYDYPINTPAGDLPAGVRAKTKGTYTCFYDSSLRLSSLRLNVGGAKIPFDLQQAGLMLVKFFFDDAEHSKQAKVSLQTLALPSAVQALIDTHRRCII